MSPGAALCCRLSQLPVRLTAERSCWVALPPALIARLLEAQAPLPLVLQLRSAAAPGRGPVTAAPRTNPARAPLGNRLRRCSDTGPCCRRRSRAACGRWRVARGVDGRGRGGPGAGGARGARTAPGPAGRRRGQRARAAGHAVRGERVRGAGQHGRLGAARAQRRLCRGAAAQPGAARPPVHDMRGLALP
jgi:hypothetical protein